MGANSDLCTIQNASKVKAILEPSLDLHFLKAACQFLTHKRPRLKAKANGRLIVTDIKIELKKEFLIRFNLNLI